MFDARTSFFGCNGEITYTPECGNPYLRFGQKDSFMRSINDNNFDSLHLKNLFNSDCDGCDSTDSYNHRIPLFLGGHGVTTKFELMKCSASCKGLKSIYFEEDLKCKNVSDFPPMQLDEEMYVLSFFIENHRVHGNIAIIINTNIHGYERKGKFGYNVYCIDKDKWLLESYDKEKMFSSKFKTNCDTSALLFDNNMLIVSTGKNMLFYDLSNLITPKFVGTFTFPYDDILYAVAMVCMKKSEERIELLFFGSERWGYDRYGQYERVVSFNKAFIKFSTTFTVAKDPQMLLSHCECERMTGMRITGLNSDAPDAPDTFRALPRARVAIAGVSCTTVVNAKDERLIIMVCFWYWPTNKDLVGRIIIFNCHSKEVAMVAESPINIDLSYREDWLPCILSHGDHLHMIDDGHDLINLRKLLQNHGQFKDLSTYLFWEQERIVWIGFEKNQDNNECMFSSKWLSKDVLCHILSFLKAK